MSKKLLTLITHDRLVFEVLYKQLKQIFGDSIKIDGFYLDGNNGSRKINSDVVVVTSEDVVKHVNRYVGNDTKIILAERTLNISCTNSLCKLLQMPAGKKVLVANNAKEINQICIDMLVKFGITHLEFIPYNPQQHEIPDGVDTAVIFGLPHQAPPGISDIIDLGFRQLDIITVIEIIQALNIECSTVHVSYFNFIRELVKMSYDFAQLAQDVKKINHVLESVVNSSDDGILVLDNDANIKLVNDTFNKFLKGKYENLDNKTFRDVLNIPFKSPVSLDGDTSIVYLNNKSFLMTVNFLDKEDKNLGYIVGMKESRVVQNLEAQLREHERLEHYKTKYVFEDIITNNNKMAELKRFAEEVAVSDFTIIIYGESGTGKELFAQSIHNASKRYKKPFIAANISSLTDSLIESELFGYEDGAFTGAKKGGKHGLFELAHTGSIFLDEIGDLPILLQCILLRVIQEREVMRVGGTKIIPIDVRIIAATNKDLQVEVSNGKFRQDLFYRLNVLPLNIPPLRERPEDILILLGFFLKQYGLSVKILSSSVLNYLQEYQWPGNVRELQNLSHYIGCLSNVYKNNNARVEEYVLQYVLSSGRKKEYISTEKATLEETVKQLEKHGYIKEFVYILSELEKASISFQNISRNKIHEKLKDSLGLSMQQVKKRMEILESAGLVSAGTTKQGTRITSEGLSFIKSIAI